ncbi:PREDICTED: transmembrane protease serine 13-like [Papilio xuthus]|uniref:Transmembrane protease serine 13-like n=1 Tax=Papilio xuthus TaxID=66420 RepID=A0AAJ7E8B3_PAPXU|nr:PREDICTED: transmembrane protease serine 13-like [Papilio xuthus]
MSEYFKFSLIVLLINKVVSFKVIEIDGEVFHDKPILRNKEIDQVNVDNKKDVDSGEEIKALLEARYKFTNDETSTRYRITRDERHSTGISESHDEKQLALVFRSYAARRIVGGMETSISMYPYNVAISRNGNHWCGGSVIDEQWIFTAGHCLESAHDGDQKKLINYIVRAGSSFHNRGGYQARINKAFFPSNYVPGNADFDFSLARLDRPMPIGRNIAVLNLPSRDYQIKTDDILIVTGWGSTDQSGYGNIPDRLRFVPVPVMAADECQHAYRFYITPRMVCAGYATGGKDACNHDSGGPAVRDGILLGIVSFGGKKCGDPQSPGVYSRVSEITSWVESTITANEASNVPELVPKILKARQREKELQKFKAQVEDKKNKIKNWLRETLSSPTFLELAKRKLKEAGFNLRRRYRRNYNDDVTDDSVLDDSLMDDINLTNQINERILGDGEDNEAEALLRMMALQEIMDENKDEDVGYRNSSRKTSMKDLIAFIT